MAAAGQGIGEFFVSLTVDAASGELTVSNLVSAMGNLEVATVAEIGALFSMGIALARIIDQAVELSLGFSQFAMHTGLSTQELQKWQRVAEQSHASANEVTQSVENLTKKLANLAVGIPDAALGAFQQLGVSPFDPITKKAKNAFQVLEEVRRALRGVRDAAQQERIITTLGLSPNLRETLLLADGLFEKRAQIVPGLSKDQLAQFDHLRQTFVEIELRTRQIGQNIASWVSPVVQKFFDFVNFVAESQLKGGAAWGAAFDRARAADKASRAAGRGGLDFKDSVLGQIIFGVDKGQRYTPQLPGVGPSAAAATEARGAGSVVIDKHDTYQIYEATDTAKVRQVIEQSWDDTLRRKTLDGFDRQQGNGGY